MRIPEDKDVNRIMYIARPTPIHFQNANKHENRLMGFMHIREVLQLPHAIFILRFWRTPRFRSWKRAISTNMRSEECSKHSENVFQCNYISHSLIRFLLDKFLTLIRFSISEQR